MHGISCISDNDNYSTVTAIIQVKQLYGNDDKRTGEIGDSHSCNPLAVAHIKMVCNIQSPAHQMIHQVRVG